MQFESEPQKNPASAGFFFYFCRLGAPNAIKRALTAGKTCYGFAFG